MGDSVGEGPSMLLSAPSLESALWDYEGLLAKPARYVSANLRPAPRRSLRPSSFTSGPRTAVVRSVLSFFSRKDAKRQISWCVS